MNVLFWERRDFHLSCSGRDISRSVWNRPSASSMVDMEISSSIIESPSPKCYMTIWDMIIYSPPLIRHYNKTWPCYRIGPYCRFWRHCLIPGGFHTTFAKDAASHQRTFTSPDTWSCPILDLHLFLCWDHSFLNVSCLRTLWVSNIPGYFYFALWVYYTIPIGFSLHRHLWASIIILLSF